MDNKGIEFTTSAYGQGFGVKMYGVDEGSGQTSLRYAVRADNATFTDALTIKTSGNIGIGTLTPSEKFEVTGNGKFNGKVGIGTTTFSTNPLYSTYKLFVTGGILSDEVRVALSANGTWADYVFAKDYKLPTIKEVEKFIAKNNHLPNVPSAKQVKEEGINVGDMARIQQEKIEELMLYIIKQDKRIDALEAKLNNK